MYDSVVNELAITLTKNVDEVSYITSNIRFSF